MKKEVGVIKGLGGEGDDVTDLGFQLKKAWLVTPLSMLTFFCIERSVPMA